MSAIYNEEYYRTKNYKEYIKRGTNTSHYEILADETIELLKQLKRPTDTIVDFGCAVGFMMEALKKHTDNVSGVDISEWARAVAIEKGFEVTEEPRYDKEFDVMYALDVLEHLKEDDLTNLFEQIKVKTIVYKLPVTDFRGGPYILDVAEADKTHQIRWTNDDWRDFFNYYGYFCLDINLTKIYHSRGAFCGIAIKHK